MTATATLRKEVYDIATDLMRQHGLTGWRFQWEQTKARAGVCKYGPKILGMSELWAQHATRDEIVNTILHEIAHAIAGPEAKHGPAWRSVARAIGCTGDRCAQKPETMPKGRYEAVCTSCNVTVGWRWRLSSGMRNARHSGCGSPVRWRDHG